jgi:serine protease Do
MRQGVDMRARSLFRGGGFPLAVAAFVMACASVACASGPGAKEAAPQTQSAVEALTRANAAVVGVQVTATEGARSAETLGYKRNGSGVVIGQDGLILTIGYLMLEAENILVVTRDQRALPAQAVAYDLATGFGLLRPLLPLRIAPVPLGSHQDLNTGDNLMVSSGGEDADVGLTELVSKRPFSGYWEYHIEAALFTSPPIGNHSGASLFNRRGELVGIGSLFVANATDESQQMPGNMFVPVDLLKPILDEMQRTGTSAKSHRPWLGLTSAEQGGRVFVVRVTRGSPADSAGMQRGDVVLAVDGERVGSLEQFYKRIWAHAKPDAEMRLTVQQGEETKVLTLKGIDRMQTLVKPKGI